ncbi:hypothetical protein NGTWS1803_23770 [Mycolicibacterium cyprinidarum]|nr:hypothetical protein NGTWS1803_23770 [Mycolicibacterium sp. NGTWS1803]
MAKPETSARDQPNNQRFADFAGTVILLMLQGFLWRATMILGAQQPAALYGGLVLLIASIALSVWRVAAKKYAWGIAVTGCVLQLVLGGVALLSHA